MKNNSKLLFDCHLDLAWNALSYKRDLSIDLQKLNLSEKNFNDHPGRGKATVTLPEMRLGKVGICLATLLSRAPVEWTSRNKYNTNFLDYPSPTIASAIAQGQLAYYTSLNESEELFTIETSGQLQNHVSKWKLGKELKIGIIVSMEGCDPIISPDHINKWYAKGLRVASLVHYGWGRYAGGTGTNGPLTAEGFKLLKNFNKFNLIVDLTHLSDQSFDQTIDIYSGPVFASHQNCRALVPGSRQFSDKQLNSIVERKGIICIACDAWMLHPNWKRGYTKPEVLSINSLADHIDHICQIAGNSYHAAIGSDLDGGFGSEQTPHELKSIADLQQLYNILLKRGFTESETDLIFHGNAYRFFRENLPN